jgi:ABC-type branched-subunit amino acid transport system ATPase component
MSPPALSLRGVSKSFSGVRALAEVGLDLWPGHTLAILGPNGSGKSTMIEVAARSLEPDSGVVEIGGRSIMNIGAHRLAGLGIGRVFQTPVPLDDLRVSDRLALSCYSQLPWRDRLRPRGILARATFVLAGYDDWTVAAGLAGRLSARMGNLTYAEQRYLDLASAAHLGRRLLLLDEPTAGLSGEERLPVIDLLRRLAARGVAILLVEHDLDFVARVADRACVMERGSIRRSGPAAEVLASGELAEIYLGGVPADA